MMKIPKSAKITIDVKGSQLKGQIKFSDGDVLALENVDSINTVLRNIYEKESNTLSDLLSSGRVIIASSKVWDKYWRDDSGNFFVKREKVKESSGAVSEEETEETKEDKKEDPKEDGALDPEVSDPKKDKPKEKKPKKKVTLRKVGVIALSTIAAGTILVGGLDVLLKKREDAKGRDLGNDDPVHDENTSVDPYSSYNGMSDEEVISNMASEQYYDGSETYEVTPDDPATIYRYTDKGSAVKYDDMETQIEVINAACNAYTPCQLDNLVVDADKYTINVINEMRNRVLNNQCSPEEFLNNFIEYIYERSTTFDGKPVKEYSELGQLGKYITIVGGATVLSRNTNYAHTSQYGNYYDTAEVLDTLDFLTHDIYTSLMSDGMTR